MVKRMANFIIYSLWALFLFGLWLIVSLFHGMNDQWWSFIITNPEKGSMYIDFSYLKLFLFASLSIVVAYFITKWINRKKK